LEALKDNDMDVRLRAVEIIRDVGSNSNIATAAIVDRFQNDQEVPVQLAALDALVVMAPANDSTPQLIKTLAQGLTTDPDWVVRALAAEALGNVGPAASAVSASLVKASKDPDVCVRTNALRALRLISP
jgi:HEAT repeat protein